MILRARIVLPVSKPPVENGAVEISGNRIIRVGTWREIRADSSDEVVDLGEVVLLPGLVNAHCHLDYTNMAGLFPPTRHFTDWIKSITTMKGQWSYSDYAESWVNGSRMLARTGTTTVGDIEALPELLPEVWQATPLRVFSFLEMTGVKSRRDPAAIVEEACEIIGSLPSGRCMAGISPHAPYSTVPELLRLAAQTAKKNNWRVCSHVSESALEYEMFAQGSGEMFDWLKRSGRDMSDCGIGTPIQHMARNGMLASNVLAVHANFLGKGDLELLAKNEVNIVHCPRSHEYFHHGAFPIETLAKIGLNISLGTDSLASVYKIRRETVELDMFEEMRTLLKNHPTVPAKEILKMATMNGASALGLGKCIGQLTAGYLADCISVPYNGNIDDVDEAVISHSGEITSSMVDGMWISAPMAHT